MKKRLLLLICILCTMAAFVGVTLAYFTDSVTASAEIKSAMIDITQIEMERKVNTDGAVVLKTFTQNQPLCPAVYSGELKAEDTVTWQSGSQSFDLAFWSNVENAVDKIVFVKNDSTTEATFRTIFAFEAYTNFDTTKLLLNRNENDYKWENIGFGTINDKIYYFMTATYIEKNDTDVTPKALAVGEVASPSLLQVAFSSEASNEDVEKFGDTYEILVVTQATQAKYGAPEDVFYTDPQKIVEAVVNKVYQPENTASPIYPPNESTENEEP